MPAASSGNEPVNDTIDRDAEFMNIGNMGLGFKTRVDHSNRHESGKQKMPTALILTIMENQHRTFAGRYPCQRIYSTLRNTVSFRARGSGAG